MVISQKTKNIFNKLYLVLRVAYCVGNKIDYNYVVGAQCLPVRIRTQTGIVPLPYYCLISPVGTMHRAPTLLFCVLFGLQTYCKWQTDN